jgi:hypothetical protein
LRKLGRPALYDTLCIVAFVLALVVYAARH